MSHPAHRGLHVFPDKTRAKAYLYGYPAPPGGWGVYLKHPGIRRFWGDYQGIRNNTGTRFPAAAGGNRSTAKQKPDPAGPKAFGNKQFVDVYVMFYWNNSNSVGTSITDSSAYSHDCVPAYSRM